MPQNKLHSVRNDSNCGETPWVDSRDELPPEQYTWTATPAGADPGKPAPGRVRKVGGAGARWGWCMVPPVAGDICGPM